MRSLHAEHPADRSQQKKKRNSSEADDACTPYFYDKSTPPNCIERMFGEPYHVDDAYPSHQISARLLLCIMCQSVVTGSIIWLQIAIRYYLVEKWSIGPSQFAGILSIIQIPFTIRLLYGLLIDSVPLFGYRRKSYLFLFGCVGVASSFGLISYHHSLATTIVCICVRSFAVAFCDVIISAVTVERSESKSHSVAIRLQSLNYFCMYVVSGIGLMVAANIEKSEKPQDIVYVYWIYFALTFLIIVASVLLPEQRHGSNSKSQAKSSYPLKSPALPSAPSSMYRKLNKSDRGITKLYHIDSPKHMHLQQALHNAEEIQMEQKYQHDDKCVHNQVQQPPEKRVCHKLLQKEHPDDADIDNDLLRMMQFFEDAETHIYESQTRDHSVTDCKPQNLNMIQDAANVVDMQQMLRLHDRPKYSVSDILELTFETFCTKSIFYPILFTFVMSTMPRSNQAIDYFLMYELGFDSNQIGSLQVVASFAFIISVIVITLYSRRTADKFSLRSVFAVWTCIGAVVPYFTLILVFGLNQRLFGLSNFFFVVIDTVLIRITTDILLLATAVLYARICPPGIEALFFTFLTSLATLGEILSYAISAFFINVFDIQCSKVYYNELDGLVLSENNTATERADVVCDFGNLWLLIITINLTTLVPLLWIFWIPNEAEMNRISMKLRQSAMSRLHHVDDDEEEHVQNEVAHAPYPPVEEKEMIALYFLAKEYLFPCLKHCIFASCIKAKDPHKR